MSRQARRGASESPWFEKRTPHVQEGIVVSRPEPAAPSSSWWIGLDRAALNAAARERQRVIHGRTPSYQSKDGHE